MGQLTAPGTRLAAQCFQESRLKADAYNTGSGASGECQFMSPAWGECLKANKARNISRFNSRWSVKCAGWYNRKLAAFWHSPRPDVERWRLVLASYNAGPGNIVKAQKKARGALLWASIAPHLHQVTGRHARETLGYVENIERWFARMLIEDR